MAFFARVILKKMKRRQGNIFILFNYIEEDEKDGCQD
jgi:hypothetical protein